MLTRLTHSAIAFAITVVVYQAYVLLAAPFLEPPLVVQATKTRTEREQETSLQATHKYRELLAAYFPAGHWTLTQPPITIENGQAMIVLDEFNPRDNGQVRVNKCALLFFPSGRVRGESPPIDAVILEAPQGAMLQMDRSFRHGAGGFGKLQRGRLTGPITVRSNMREPGPQDDLWLTTEDVELSKDLIYTQALVDMQLGPHRGSGRGLEIRLDANERRRAVGNDSQEGGASIGRLDSLEILSEVKAKVSLEKMTLGAQSEQKKEDLPSPPVQISCTGHFRFDFSSQVASFDKQVQLQQIHPQGQLDQLLCSKLSIYLTHALPEITTKTAATSQTTTKSSLGKLYPGLIEAIGDGNSPVVLSAQSYQASALCERLRIEPKQRRVTFDRGPEVILTYQGSEIHAQQVRYELPPEESEGRIGNLLAAGRGRLRVLTSEEPDADPFEVRWTENMQLRRTNGQPVLTLNGRPRLDMVGLGELWADHLDLYLRERAADGSEDDLLPGDIVPSRLVAGGSIAIKSAQLRGEVQQLGIRFDYAPSDLLLTSPDGNSSPAEKIRLGRGKASSVRSYDISGDTLEMLVTVRQREPELTSINIDGQVVFHESAQAATAKRPLEVHADHLRIENADSPAAKISLSGKPATILADGMLIRTENLQIHRGTSRAWVNAPGEIEIMVDRDLSGKQLAAPQPMTIQWQRGMELNQDRIIFSGDVRVLSGEGTLHTQQMTVTLTAPVQFDGAASQRRIDIAQLQCSGGVTAVFSQRDAVGLASIQTIKLEESFLVNLQTGQIRGDGPGSIESVHLSSGDNPFGEMAKENGRRRLASTLPQSRPKGSQQTQHLNFLGVEFIRGIQGNLKSRQVKVYGDVEAVYGPVDAWEQRLALTKRGMPGPDTIWISSQSLGVAESPLARLSRGDRSQQKGLGPIELEAQGNVTIEGPAGERGNFTTHSLLAKYNQLKKTFILEGNNQQPATILFQEYRGGPTSPTTARKITYFQESGQVKVEGMMNLQLRQISPRR